MSPVVSGAGALDLIGSEIRDDFLAERREDFSRVQLRPNRGLFQPSAEDYGVALARTIQQQNRRLYRKLLKRAKAARGLVPVTNDKGDAKRALAQIVGASGRQRRKARKAIQRAMREQQS
ncbi:hypothetical protein [Humibacter sp.]|uniref:hypothetical protein n=1 Tax=Humibacter sp. TaxID=1940291 RepID=UPI003F7DD814